MENGEGGIRTLDPSFSPDNCLAGSPVRPLQHLSGRIAKLVLGMPNYRFFTQRSSIVNRSGRAFAVPDDRNLLILKNLHQHEIVVETQMLCS
jgi:hypothetical protein